MSDTFDGNALVATHIEIFINFLVARLVVRLGQVIRLVAPPPRIHAERPRHGVAHGALFLVPPPPLLQ
jgi:hypothetical protein